MNKNTLLLFVSFFFISFLSIFGQEVNETPNHFGQFYNNPLLNISKNGLDSKFEINLDNQRNVGGYGGVSTSYFSFFYNPEVKKKSKNIYGLYFYNDKEGDYISRNRIQFVFSRHQKISKNWNLSLGISGGLYLFGIKPNTSTGAYSANSFVGNSSLLFYNKKFQVGVSMNQFTNSKIQPVTQITRLKRHYYLYSQYIFKKESIQFIPSAFLKYENIQDPLSLKKEINYGGSLRFIYKIIMAGVTYDNEGIYITTGLNDWEIAREKKIRINFSYFIPVALQTNVIVNRMELNLQLKL